MSRSVALQKYRNVVNDLKSFHPTTGSFEAEEEEAIISGDALGEGTWNMFYYPSDELKRATDSLVGVPLVIGHGKTEQDEVGEVTDAEWNDDREVIEFDAKVTSDKVSQMIKRGVVDSVSVGVEFDEENKGEERIATNLDFYELALVKEPAFVDGIKEIIDDQIPEEEQDKLNEMSSGGENQMDKETNQSNSKVILDIPKKIYNDLHNKDELSVIGVYPSSDYPYKYPKASYSYPKGKEDEPSPLTNTFKEIFRRMDKLADEVGIEFETEYEYPKPKYPEVEETEDLDELEEDRVLQVEVDVERAQGILDDLDNYITDLVDEVGYPGSDTEFADRLEDVNERLEALAEELGMELE